MMAKACASQSGSVRPQARVKKERGVWVSQTEPNGVSICALIDRVREKRGRDLSEMTDFFDSPIAH